MTVRETILQQVRSFAKQILTLTDAQIIVGNEQGSRPPLPYIAVFINSIDIPEGQDQELRYIDEDDNPAVQIRGSRRATVNIQAFGADAEEWLTALCLSLQSPVTRAILDELDLSIVRLGSIIDLSSLLDTSIQKRFSQDFEVYYYVNSESESLVAPEQVDFNSTIQKKPISETDPDALESEYTHLP